MHKHNWEWDHEEEWFICKNCPYETDTDFVVVTPKELLAENQRLRDALEESTRWIDAICNCSSADEMWAYAHLNDPALENAT